ncbi:MAG: SH3 domain-containing protein, partial [Lachnospiraceae bacterium]|nr:SH3 domain-containing protein [Lachnospiraceae bacterium]
MWKVSRKSLSLLSLFLIWILTSGFEDLDVETSAGIGAVMENVTSDDIEAVQLEEEWEDKVLARVDEYVTVRSEPNADSKALGRMFKGDGGNIVEQVDGWTKIHSGNVEGYVDNEYLVFGTEAYELAQEEVTLVATSLTGGLRIRSEASTEAKILKNVE